MNPKKILFVEDEPLYYKIYEEPLKAAGYDAKHEANGEGALDTLKKESFDLMIVDLLMPIMSGQTFLKELRKRKIHIPIIVLTTLEGDTDREDAKMFGVKTFLYKSDTPADKLIEEVKKYL